MWRLLMAMALAVVVVSAVTASAALLVVQPGQLAVFTYPVDIGVTPPIGGCEDNDGEIESTAEDGENPGEDRLVEYEIRPGDTLTDIAARFGTTVEPLARLNDLEDPRLIFYGWKLKLRHVGDEPAAAEMPPSATPMRTVKYEVQPGDTLVDIAARFGTTAEVVAQINGLEDPRVILYGTTLNVPYVRRDPGDGTVGVSP